MENQFGTVFKGGDKVRLARVPPGCVPHRFLKRNKGVVYVVEKVECFSTGTVFYYINPVLKTFKTRFSRWCVSQKDIRHVK